MKKKLNFKNYIFSKKELKNIMYETFLSFGMNQASSLADDIKKLGFQYATQAGISISVEDLKITPEKSSILSATSDEILAVNKQYDRGEISQIERFQTIINVWNNTSESLKTALVDYFKQADPLNSIYLMAFSGARGNLSQVRQLVGMRGLMSDPNGQIIDIPIIHNFREGLTITDYIMSSYGARKGVVDTALKTADSGYLTRRLVDVAQDILVRETDCKTRGKVRIKLAGVSPESLYNKLIGRVSAQAVYSSSKKTYLLKPNSIISKEVVQSLVHEQLESISIRSPLTCASPRSVCQLCYGWDLATGTTIKLGEAIGILAAQSIGEPGTQLTMRTFHTGGIFTADPSRQVRVENSGILNYDEKSPLRSIRTMYGKKILLLEQNLNLSVTDFNNEDFTFTLPVNSFLFVKNSSFVKKGQLIAELPIFNQQTLKSSKSIVSPISGKLLVDKENEVIWIFEGTVLNIPTKSFLNNLFERPTISTSDVIFSFKLKTSNSGLVHINQEQNLLKQVRIFNCLSYANVPIFFDKGEHKFFFLLESDILCTLNTSTLNAPQSIFATQANYYYSVPFGGYSFVRNLSSDKHLLSYSSDLFYIPEDSYTVNKENCVFLLSDGAFLPNPGVEIVSGMVSQTYGFLQIVEENDILQYITIKPAQYFEFFELTSDEYDELYLLHNQIRFPGETIFDGIEVPYLCVIETYALFSIYFIILRPILDFRIPKPRIGNKLKTQLVSVADKIELSFSSVLNITLDTITRYKVPTSLVNSSYSLDNCSFLPLTMYFTRYANNVSHPIMALALATEEKIDIKRSKFQSFPDYDAAINLGVSHLQFVEPGTILGWLTFSTLTSLEPIIKDFRFDTNQKFYLTSQHNYLSFFSHRPNFLPAVNECLRSGDLITPTVTTTNSARVINKSAFELTLQRASSLFLKDGMAININNNSYICKGDYIGKLMFDQVITGDIVQGLPKIEEILEARKPSKPTLLAERMGILRFMQFPSVKRKRLTIHFDQGFSDPLNTNPELLTVSIGDFVMLGQPLTVGAISPHDLLANFFNYYSGYWRPIEAADLSFKNLQILLIQKIQSVYESQGVTINDKHLEVIVRQMTTKVKVTSPGDSFLVSDEILDLRQLSYINKALVTLELKPALFEPLLFGITRVSLLTDSFISAASFQETTKILTGAAIQGRVDWLRGLKENVIIGHLIPAGTGFSSVNKKLSSRLHFL